MPNCSPDVISCKGIYKTFETEKGSITAVSNVELCLTHSETLAILGPSGCGKSTLLLMMAGLEKPSSGSIEFKGNTLVRPHREIGLVLQDYGLFPWKNVRKNIELGLKIRREPTIGIGIGSLLTELGIAEKSDAYPQQLSGGQKQRVALARALVLNPSLLLLDEPFAALDTLTRERLQELVLLVWRKRRFGMVLVTHNIQEAVFLGRSIAIMANGPGRIVDIIDNVEAGQESFRNTQIFYERCVYVRSRMEKLL